MDSNELEKYFRDQLQAPIHIVTSTSTLDRKKLNDRQKLRLKDMSSVKRQIDYLRGQNALFQLIENVELETGVELQSFPSPYFSLSHIDSLAIAVVCNSAKSQGVGIDLEINRMVNPRTQKFFLSKTELSLADRIKKTDDWLRIWTVKEALFKAYPKNQGCVLSQFEMDSLFNLTGEALFLPDPSHSFVYCSKKVEKGWVSLALKKINPSP